MEGGEIECHDIEAGIGTHSLGEGETERSMF